MREGEWEVNGVVKAARSGEAKVRSVSIYLVLDS